MSTLSSHFHSIAKSRLAKQALTLASGTALAQCIGTLAAPILSRLYTPAEFGVLGSLIAIIGVIALIGSLKYEMAIVTETTEQNAIAVTGLSCLLLTTVTILSAVCFLATILLSPSAIKEPQLLNMLPYGIVIIFSTGLYNILNFFLIRQEKYNSLAKGRIAKRIGTVLVQIIMGTQGASVLGLVCGNIAGWAIGIFTLVSTGFKKQTFPPPLPAKPEMVHIAKKHFRFPLYTAPQDLLNALSQQLPIYIFGFYYGLEVVGLYWFAMRIIQLPVSLVGQSIRQVFYKGASDRIDNPIKLFELYKKTTLLLTFAIILPATIIFLYGQGIFSLVFGQEWAASGQYAEWMFLWISIAMINPPATSTLHVLKKQKNLLIFDSVLFIARLMTLIISCNKFQALYSIKLYSIIGIIFNIFIIFYVYITLKRTI